MWLELVLDEDSGLWTVKGVGVPDPPATVHVGRNAELPDEHFTWYPTWRGYLRALFRRFRD